MIDMIKINKSSSRVGPASMILRLVNWLLVRSLITLLFCSLSLSLRCSLRCCRQALNDDDKGRWWLCKHSGSCAVVLFDADLFALKKSLFDIYFLCQADWIVKNKVVLVQMSNLHSPEFDLLAHSHLGANSLNKTKRDCHIFCQKRTQMFSDNFLTNPIVWVYENQSRKRVSGKTYLYQGSKRIKTTITPSYWTNRHIWVRGLLCISDDIIWPFGMLLSFQLAGRSAGNW